MRGAVVVWIRDRDCEGRGRTALLRCEVRYAVRRNLGVTNVRSGCGDGVHWLVAVLPRWQACGVCISASTECLSPSTLGDRDSGAVILCHTGARVRGGVKGGVRCTPGAMGQQIGIARG